LIGCSY